MKLPRRRRRLPSYIGVVYWGFFLALLLYASFNSGVFYGVVFGAAFVGLLVLCLWFYGVIAGAAETATGQTNGREGGSAGE